MQHLRLNTGALWNISLEHLIYLKAFLVPHGKNIQLKWEWTGGGGHLIPKRAREQSWLEHDIKNVLQCVILSFAKPLKFLTNIVSIVRGEMYVQNDNVFVYLFNSLRYRVSRLGQIQRKWQFWRRTPPGWSTSFMLQKLQQLYLYSLTTSRSVTERQIHWLASRVNFRRGRSGGNFNRV